MYRLGTDENPLRIAVVGSGPSGFYAAEALLQSDHSIEVDVLERLPVPYGLVRHGVAPDHPRLKEVANTYATIARHPRFSFAGNVALGSDLILKDLESCYHAVILATGAAADRKLDIPGEEIPGIYAATAFVGWYNGHPDCRDLDFDLSSESAVIIGQGNVSIDICRILAKSADELRKTDIAAHALDVLADSRVREIHLVGRRGPVQARFTSKELRELGQLSECDPSVDPGDLLPGDTCKSELSDIREPTRARNFEIFRSFASRRQEKPKRCHFHFYLSPRHARGEDRLEEIVFERNRLVGAPGRQEAIGTGETVTIKTGLMIRSIGYRGLPLAGVPFDEALGIVPNTDGRIATPLDEYPVYATGWIKRGPNGIIGTNRADSTATVERLLKDLPNFASHPKPGRQALMALLAQRAVRPVTFADWEAIDVAERERGLPSGKPREKFTRIPEMLAACGSQPRGFPGRRTEQD